MAGAGKAHYQQGLALERAGDLPGAFQAYRLSAREDPRIAAPYVGLSRILLANQQRSQAIACLERAVSCEPANPGVLTLLGQAVSQDGQLERARQVFEQVLRLDSASAAAWLGMGGVHEDLGNRADAAHAYLRLLAYEPDDAQGLAGLLGVAREADLESAIERAQARLQSAADRDRALIGYALGKALDRQGRHDPAFEAWTAANAARRRVAGAFDAGHFDRRITRLTEIFSKDFCAARRGWGDPSEQPVFVVGLPRSGTTLTEQILASHTSVFGAGELDVLTDMATGTPDRLGRTDPPWPDAAGELTQALTADIARDHLARLSALAPPGTRRVVDKQPLNFWHLGLVALTLPNARIIHCTRNLRDNGLSVYAENFSPEQRWATDLRDIAHYWGGCRRLMTHWRDVTGLQILEVSYQETVADLAGQARRLADFIGLQPVPAMIDFHRANRAVQTPSRWQVRRPLYASSVGRWQRYASHLAPLTAAYGEGTRS